MMTHKSIRRELVKAVYGDFTQWRQACELARDNGWTLPQVERILYIYHPLTFIVVYFPLALLLLGVGAYLF